MPAVPAEHKVILVEPSKFLCAVIGRACGKLGIEVLPVEEIGAALTCIGHSKPAAVITAFELPGFSGNALIAALKSSPEYRAIPICLLTTPPTSQAQLGAYKPDITITKDAHAIDGLTRFLKSLGLVNNDTNKLRLPGDGSVKPDILVVEDTRVIHKLMAKILHVSGADVTVVENGAEAVLVARSKRFDLILMDVEMPVMDGREATRQIRQLDIDVPIVAFTAHDPDKFRQENLDVGFSDVADKSTKRQALVELCQKHLCELSVNKSPTAS